MTDVAKTNGASGAPNSTNGGPPRPELVDPEYDVEVKLADQQADPNSPLYSAKSFEALGLRPELLKGIYNMKFTKPSKIQEKALPLLLGQGNPNLIGQSQSGTGKTAAFVLTMLMRCDPTKNTPQAICIAPSRELARQIMDVVREMAKFSTITTAFAIPDPNVKPTKIDAQVVIATPGKLVDLLKKKLIDTAGVKVFVLDEADQMLDQSGLGEQSIRLKNLMPKTCQIVLFSATFPDRVRTFASRFAQPNANEIRLKHNELSVEGIKQFYMDCRDDAHKFEILSSLYSVLTIGQSIIFVRKRETSDEIARRMTADGHVVTSLHGGLDPKERDMVMDAFRNGKTKVLLTTNVIARGIDISQVTLVINYDMPTDNNGRPDPETYLHRIGRTGRFGRTGVSINFVHDRQSYEEMKAIEEHFGREIVKVPTDLESMEKVLKKAIK